MIEIGDAKMKHQFTIGTFNIRYGLADDGINIWDNRKELVIDSIHDKLPDIIGFQEALPFVKEYLDKNLSDYIIVGTGRDKDLGGEDNCIAIRRETFELIALETFWLSPEPYVFGSQFENNDGLPRICTMVTLRSKINNRIIRAFNTHLDYRFSDVRLKQLKVLNEFIKQYDDRMPLPNFLIGDLNSVPDSKEIEYVLEDFAVKMVDISTSDQIKSDTTFHGFFNGLDYVGKIDFIFATPDINCIKSYIDDTEREGVYLSDHYPVYAVIEMES